MRSRLCAIIILFIALSFLASTSFEEKVRETDELAGQFWTRAEKSDAIKHIFIDTTLPDWRNAYDLSPTPNWIVESNATMSYFGKSVASGGDVNGDGYDDVIVGAFYYNNGNGAVYVYYGTHSGLSLTPNWCVTLEGEYAYFGHSVASAGDVNGDGYADIIVGAPELSPTEGGEGAVFVFHGGPTGLSTTANWSADVNKPGANFGYSVSSAGDVNGDGYDDVIIGARYFSNGQDLEGRAYVFYGSASGLLASPAWFVEGNQLAAALGSSVASAGDVNDDGYDDVILGAPSYDNGQEDEGKVFVYHGSHAGLSTSPAWTVESNQAEAGMGTVSPAGDINGDGYDDVLVAATGYSNDQEDEGRVFAFLGSSSGLLTVPHWTAESNHTKSAFGRSLAGAGDLNGDHYDDIIIGASSWDTVLSNEGKAFVYYGSAAGLSASWAWTYELEQAYAEFGTSVASAGDVNGDGVNEVLVGAPGYDNDQQDEGRAYVFYGECPGCSIDGECYLDGEVNPENVCQICNVSWSTLAWTDNDGTFCDDGLFCNGADVCAGGVCVDHAGNPCDPLNETCDETNDECVPLEDDDTADDDTTDDDTTDDDAVDDDAADDDATDDDDDDDDQSVDNDDDDVDDGCGC